MKYVAAYLLAQLGGKASPSAEDITSILSSVGIEADSARVDALLKEVKGKDVNELIAEGKKKLSAVPSGGGGAAAAPAAAAGAAPAAKEDKKEEKKKVEEEKKDESDVSTLSIHSIFIIFLIILFHFSPCSSSSISQILMYITGGYGLRSLRLSCTTQLSPINVECIGTEIKHAVTSPISSKYSI